ncbi:unnamed protein product, partial [Brassica napus]
MLLIDDRYANNSWSKTLVFFVDRNVIIISVRYYGDVPLVQLFVMNLTVRVKEQLERSRQRLYHERPQIIAARLGAPPSMSSKASLPTNRTAANFGNVAQRPPMGMSFPRPPMPRPPGTSSFSVPGSHVAATAVTGSSGPPPGSDNLDMLQEENETVLDKV